MKRAALILTQTAILTAWLTLPAAAKDKEIPLTAAPAGVQATVKKVIAAGATVEKVELEEESDGTQFGVKLTDKNGIRWEMIMAADGKVVKTEKKKAKKVE
jgi:uncharacterized glyoxalase superfamily protein PhnB